MINVNNGRAIVCPPILEKGLLSLRPLACFGALLAVRMISPPCLL